MQMVLLVTGTAATQQIMHTEDKDDEGVSSGLVSLQWCLIHDGLLLCLFSPK